MSSGTERKIRSIIIDDELHARENLKFMLEDCCPEIAVVGTADSVSSAFTLYHKVNPELLFLDIRMPSASEGFELIERLEGEKFEVIFVTAFKEYAIRAFEQRALHYILKPLDEEDLKEAVKRVVERTHLRNDEEIDFDMDALKDIRSEIEKPSETKRLTIHHSKGIKIVDIQDIYFLESSGNCTLMHFSNRDSYLDTRTLKVYEALLPVHFFRVHRSYIVNLKEVSEILHGDEQVVVLKSNQRIPVAKERKKDLLERIRLMSG